MEETLKTLNIADMTKKIKNKPIVNIGPQVAENQKKRYQSAPNLHSTGGGDLVPELLI